MSTKSITIKEDAYNMLKSWKGESESFSDVVMKLAARPKLSDFIGVLSGEAGGMFEKAIKDSRKASRRRIERLSKEFR